MCNDQFLPRCKITLAAAYTQCTCTCRLYNYTCKLESPMLNKRSRCLTKKTNNFFVLQAMHMGLESLESILNHTSFKIKIIPIAYCEHIKPENTNTLIINTFRGHVFTMEELAFHTINTFYGC